jgi:hypothetical protein
MTNSLESWHNPALTDIHHRSAKQASALLAAAGRTGGNRTGGARESFKGIFVRDLKMLAVTARTSISVPPSGSG